MVLYVTFNNKSLFSLTLERFDNNFLSLSFVAQGQISRQMGALQGVFSQKFTSGMLFK